MDDIKDISKKESGPDYFKDISIRTRAFGSNSHGERAYQRAERVVAALYLVTNHVSEDEVLRRSIRHSALRLLANILGLRNVLRVENSREQGDVKGIIRKLITLVRLLVVAGKMSVQNAELLVGALDDLGGYLTAAQKTPQAETIVLGQDDFTTNTTTYGRPTIPRQTTRKGHTQTRKENNREEPNTVSDRGDRSEVRMNNVLSVLKPGSNLGIKDIVAQLPEYSEKMIQRELKHLVTLGKVAKSGSKRWSLYALAQQ